MYNDKEKLSTGIRNEQDESAIYPAGNNEPLHKTKEDIRPMPEEAKPEQEKKSDTRYVGESSKGVKKTNMANVDDDEPKKDNNEQEEAAESEELIEKTTWEVPQPEKDKDVPL